MNCSDVGFGTYNCAYNIMPPFKTGFNNEYKYVAIDKCLLKEVISLWEKGIRTTGCCCGHGKLEPFIGVEFDDIQKMKDLGYKVQFNKYRPNDDDSFYPKTIINYGEINKGFNYWDNE